MLAALVFAAYVWYVVVSFAEQSSRVQAILGLIIIGVPSFLFAALGRFTLRPYYSPEDIAVDRLEFESRLLNPDWKFYEQHLQRTPPACLRKLYSDRALVTSQSLRFSEACGISSFEPLDEQSLLDSREQLGFDAVPFATSDFGDPIYLRPGASQSDTVFMTHHDGGDTETLAESIDAMLEILKHQNLVATKK